MNTDKYISLDNLNYFAGGFKSLIKDTTVPSVKLKSSSGKDYIQRSDIKNLGEGSFICYIDENNRYRVNSTEYIYGPAIFFTSYSVVDYGDGNKDIFDFLVLSPTVAKRYKTNQDDITSFTYSWVDYVTSDNFQNDISEISSDSSIATLNINSPIGVVTNASGITVSWIDYISSTSETMLLPYNTFILGNTSEAVLNSGDVQILMPDGKRYNISDLTATSATVTEISTGGGSSLDVAEIDTAGTYTLNTFIAHNKTIITGLNVKLTYDERSFYSFTGTYPTVTKDLPIGTVVTCDSANTCLYIEKPNGWNYKLIYNQDTIPKAIMVPDTSQIAYDKTESNYLINNIYSDTKDMILALINETQFNEIISNGISKTNTRAFLKVVDSNHTPINLVFEFIFTAGSNAVGLDVHSIGAYPSSSGSGSYNWGITYYQINKYSTSSRAYIKLSDLITRNVTKVYTTNALTTEQNYWFLNESRAGYMLMNNSDILGKNNSSSYTPTSDYNPATKKYVDDAINAALANMNKTT